MPIQPDHDCPLCPRLIDFRLEARAREPHWHNGPVPSFGSLDARVLIVGLAPGLRGANRTGRPFTGDSAGDLLYATLLAHGFAHGTYERRPDDTLKLDDVMIVNAVRCVPPQNKPTPEEIRTCRPFLVHAIAAMPNLRAIVALGRIAHESVLRTLDCKLKDTPFVHGAQHSLSTRGLALFDSYHCSRYNTNTGVLTPQMFADVFAQLRKSLAQK